MNETKAIWNYDSFTIKTVASTSFSCMINVAGKLWCTTNNAIKVLNPNSLDCEVSELLSFCHLRVKKNLEKCAFSTTTKISK